MKREPDSLPEELAWWTAVMVELAGKSANPGTSGFGEGGLVERPMELCLSVATSAFVRASRVGPGGPEVSRAKIWSEKQCVNQRKEKLDPPRTSASVCHEVSPSENNGHCFISPSQSSYPFRFWPNLSI